MAFEINILGEVIGGVLDDTKGLDGVWEYGHTYRIEVVDRISCVDYISGYGYHIVKDHNIHWNKFGVYNTPFQSLDSVNTAYDYTDGVTGSNYNDIITDYDGDRIATVTSFSNTKTGQTDTGYVNYSGLNIRRITQTLTQIYNVTVLTVDNDAIYYLAGWRYTTPLGDATEGDSTPSAILVSSYLAIAAIPYTLYGDYSYDPNYIDPNVYYNYTSSELITIPLYIGVEPPDEGGVDDLVSWPSARDTEYDPDLVWVPYGWDGDTYTPPEWDEPAGNYVVAGGGRFGISLISCCNGNIYYEEIS